MLLRKLVATLCPLLLCLITCMVFRWLDGMQGLPAFFSYTIKGLLIGICLALILPLGGISMRTNGLMPWLLVGAGLLTMIIVIQYLISLGIITSQVLLSILAFNGHVLMAEGAVTGFMCTMGLMLRRR